MVAGPEVGRGHCSSNDLNLPKSVNNKSSGIEPVIE
jgi:hypothetical protein